MRFDATTRRARRGARGNRAGCGGPGGARTRTFLALRAAFRSRAGSRRCRSTRATAALARPAAASSTARPRPAARGGRARGRAIPRPPPALSPGAPRPPWPRPPGDAVAKAATIPRYRRFRRRRRLLGDGAVRSWGRGAPSGIILGTALARKARRADKGWVTLPVPLPVTFVH